MASLGGPMKTVAAVLVLLIFANQSPAQESQEASYYTAADLVKHCTAASALVDGSLATRDDTTFTKRFGDANQCIGFITAFKDFNQFISSTLFCAPKEATRQQFGKVFLKYMEDHPEKLHRPAIEMMSAQRSLVPKS